MDKEILYRFIRMELVQFATFDDVPASCDNDIEVASKFQFSYNFETDMMCCTTSVTVMSSTTPLLKVVLSSYFGIEPASAKSLKVSDDLVAPAELLAQFASLTYGAIRGVIFAKTIGSPLNSIVLPPNDISAIIQTPQRFVKI